MADAIVFVDTETTGLEPFRHEAWEIALIEPDGAEFVWRIEPDLRKASVDALRVTGYYARVTDPDWYWNDPTRTAVEIATRTAGRHLVGAVPSFDAAFLTSLLRAHGLQAAWHYHLVDVEALAAGKLGIAPPWDSDRLAEALGVDALDGRHTALGDARWARAIYRAVLG